MKKKQIDKDDETVIPCLSFTEASQKPTFNKLTLIKGFHDPNQIIPVICFTIQLIFVSDIKNIIKLHLNIPDCTSQEFDKKDIESNVSDILEMNWNCDDYDTDGDKVPFPITF